MRRSNDQSLGELIKEFLKNNNLEDRITEAQIVPVWEKVMGPHIARYTDRMRLQHNCLTVYLSSSVLRNELSMAKSKIIQMINKEFEQEVIKEIFLR